MGAVADSFSLHLSGADQPQGEIAFAHVPAICEALQTLSTRIGQHLAGKAGPGRPSDVVRHATELRLRGVRPGSTVLDVALGDEAVLVDVGLEHEVTDSLFELFAGVGQNQPPSWTTATLGEATIGVVDAVGSAATDVSFTSETRAAVRFRPAVVDRAIWPGAAKDAPDVAVVSLSGTLDRADLRSSRFRIRDVTGHDIALEHVENPQAAAKLLGATVTASGISVRNDVGRIIRLRSATVEPVELPPSATRPPVVPDLAHAQPTVIPVDGVADVSDDEVDEFLASLT